MMTDESQDLLRRYHRERCEPAFRRLVEIHGPVVFATALRKLAGDRAAAQDVTQEVFGLLARKAGRLEQVVISGWLYRQTCRRAANHVRSETRRRRREQLAISPAGPQSADAGELKESLDSAMMTLPEKDRDALVLRFFEGRDYRGVGQALGLAEEAARKRVKRALDKLAAVLSRRDIAFGAAGASPEPFEAPGLPRELISKIAHASTSKAAAAGGGVSFPWWKPVALGVLTSSLIVPPLLAFRSSEPAAPASALTSATRPGSVADRQTPDDESEASLEQIIAEIKLAKSGPAHALGTLRLEAVLERLQVERYPEFFALARDMLTPEEKAACYERLLDRWAATDPEAATTFAAVEQLGDEVNPTRGTNLVTNLFEFFLRRDRKSAGSWLLEHWDLESLQTSAFRGTLREHLASHVTYSTLRSEGAAEAIGLADDLPSEAARRTALEALVGSSPYFSSWMNLDASGMLALHRALAALPDRELSSALVSRLWFEATKHSPEKVDVGQMTAAERYQRELGSVGIGIRPAKSTELLEGGRMISYEQTDPLASLDRAIQAGAEAGLERSEVLVQVGAALLSRVSEEDGLRWVANHRDEVNLDEALVKQVSVIGVYDGVTIGGEGPEQRIIRLADHLRDDSLRRTYSRAAFRRILARSTEEAETFLSTTGISGDLLEELQSIAAPDR